MAFVCVSCGKTYPQKKSLILHQKTHEGTQYSCEECSKVFARRDSLARHITSVHRFVKNSPEFNAALRINGQQIHVRVIESPIVTPTTQSTVGTSAISPQPVASTSSTSVPRKRRGEKSTKKVDIKKTRMQLVRTSGFIEIDASLRRKVVWYYRRNLDDAVSSYHTFLTSIKSELVDRLQDCMRSGPKKYNLKLEATYHVPNVETSIENRSFKTSAREMFLHSDIEGMVDEDFAILLVEEDVYACKGSGFTLSRIDGLLLGVYEYTPLGGSSYIPLPTNIANRLAIINPQNIDQRCFVWAILAKHVKHDRARVGKNYLNEIYRYDFSTVSEPTPVSDIILFERSNPGTSVNVYGVYSNKNSKTQNVVYPIRVVDEEREDHFDLLFIDDADGEKSHYTYISNFSRLVSTQKNARQHQIFTCKRCFTSFDDSPRKCKLRGSEALAEHAKICGAHKPVLPIMPQEGETLKFEGWCKTQHLPFVIYADFEALLRPIDQQHGENTRAFQQHQAMSFGYLVKAADHIPVELLEKFDIPLVPVIYRGSAAETEVGKEFVQSVVDVVARICELLKTTNVPIVMTDEERKVHGATTCCQLCKSVFDIHNWRTVHHDHLSGLFLKSLCNNCNLKLKTPNFVPCFLHNLSRYDAHFIVTELGYDEHRIPVIPNSEENYISFSKYIDSNFAIRFVDSCRFMASSLATLAKNLVTEDFIKFGETSKIFSPNDMPLVTRKGVYPYEYTDDWSKLCETELPARDEFYSTLTDTHIDFKDYEHAQRVWDHFDCHTLADYSDLYLKIDVLLLADVFENFRRLCISTYNLDPAYYYTAPGFTFDCMLKYTEIELELVSDYDQLLMLEAGIRGGLVQASKRYARANNKHTPGFDDDLVKTWLVYQDCNNLYGWAMSQNMPNGGFSWYTGNLDDAIAQLDNMRGSDNIGRVYEVDISYPKELHDLQNELPFLPHSSVPRGSTVKKLMATFETKTNYVVHYLNLKQAIANGLVVNKVHRVLEFRQSPFLKSYIDLNTGMRQKAANDFEKDFFKLMNNSMFGKTMESMRKRMKMELVSSPTRIQKLINRPTFKNCTTYNDRLAAVSLHNKTVEFCKPIYIGFAVLELSKTLMYDYHYNVMKKHYKTDIELMYTDTDSLLYHIRTDDYYQDLLENPNLLGKMDTSNLPGNHPCFSLERKKIPGFFTDETGGKTMLEFVALRAKSYAYIIDGQGSTVKAKGIRAHVTKSLTFDVHKKCLFEDDDDDDDDDDIDDDVDDEALSKYRENISIRSYKHSVKTIKMLKLTLNNFDDKRVVSDNKVLTTAYGHYNN